MLQVQLDRCRRDTVVYAHIELRHEQWPFPFASDAFSSPSYDSWTCRTTGDKSTPLRPLLLSASHPDVCVFAEKDGRVTTLPLPLTVFVPFGSLFCSVPLVATSLPRQTRVTFRAKTPACLQWDEIDIVTVSRSRDIRPSPVELLEEGETAAGPGTPLPKGRPQLVDLNELFLIKKVARPQAFSIVTAALVEKRIASLLESLLPSV